MVTGSSQQAETREDSSDDAPLLSSAVTGSPEYDRTRREAANQSSEPRVGSSDLAGAATQPRIRKTGGSFRHPPSTRTSAVNPRPLQTDVFSARPVVSA